MKHRKKFYEVKFCKKNFQSETRYFILKNVLSTLIFNKKFIFVSLLCVVNLSCSFILGHSFSVSEKLRIFFEIWWEYLVTDCLTDCRHMIHWVSRMIWDKTVITDVSKFNSRNTFFLTFFCCNCFRLLFFRTFNFLFHNFLSF